VRCVCVSSQGRLSQSLTFLCRGPYASDNCLNRWQIIADLLHLFEFMSDRYHRDWKRLVESHSIVWAGFLSWWQDHHWKAVLTRGPLLRGCSFCVDIFEEVLLGSGCWILTAWWEIIRFGKRPSSDNSFLGEALY